MNTPNAQPSLTAKTITRADLNAIQTPEATKSYAPVPYPDLLEIMDQKAGEVLQDEYDLHKTRYQVLSDGSKFMATHVWKKSEDDEMGISFFVKSSHNKEWPITFLFGEGNISACFNGMIFGAVEFSQSVRRHTRHVYDDLPKAANRAADGVWERFSKLNEDMDHLKRKPFGSEDMFKFGGMLLGRNIIKTKHFNPIIKEFETPRFDEFKPRNMWSGYNAVTEILKTVPLAENLTRHSDLHEAAMEF